MSSFKIKLHVFLLLTLLIFHLGSFKLSYAATKGVGAISFRPVLDGGSFLNTLDAHQNISNRFHFGLATTFAYRVLSVERSATVKDRLLEEAALAHFNAAYKVNNWWVLGFEMPIGLHETRPETQVGGSSSDSFVVGDPMIGAKFNLLPWNSKNFSFAFSPFLYIPAGFGENYAGSGKVSGGGKFIVSYSGLQRFHFATNLGLLLQEEHPIGNQSNGHQFTINAAISADLTPHLSGLVEFSLRAEAADPFDSKIQTPTEIIVGLKRSFETSGMNVYAAGGYGLSHENGVPLWRGVMGFRQDF